MYLAALRESNSIAYHARRVSCAAKVPALQEKDASPAERYSFVLERYVALSMVKDLDRAFPDLTARYHAVESQLTTCRNELPSLNQSVSAARDHVSSGQATAIKTRREFEGATKGDLSDFSESMLGQTTV